MVCASFGPDAGRLRKLFLRSAHDLIDGAELFHERRALLLADAPDLVEDGGEVALAVQVPEIGDGEAVRLVADALQGAERVVAAGKAHGLGGSERIDLLLLLGERDEVDAADAQLFEDRIRTAESCPLPPSMTMSWGLGKRSSSSVPSFERRRESTSLREAKSSAPSTVLILKRR